MQEKKITTTNNFLYKYIYIMIEKINMKLLIVAALILLFIYLKTNPKSVCCLVENMTPNDAKETVRKMSDYYTLKTGGKQKILELNCKIGEIKYKFGFMDKIKFNNTCNLCEKMNLKNLMPVLVNSTKTSKKTCEHDELIKCYNNNDVIDCANNAETLCNNTIITSDNTEFILYNIQQKNIDKGGIDMGPSYVLKLGNDKLSVLSLIATQIEAKNKTTGIIEKKLIYFCCCQKILGEFTDKEKIYLERYTVTKDKICFKLYFFIPDSENGEPKKKYLGHASQNLCDNIICKDATCASDIKFLTLYSDVTNSNILIFEPELVRLD